MCLLSQNFEKVGKFILPWQLSPDAFPPLWTAAEEGVARHCGILQLNAVHASGQGQISGRTKPGRTPVWLVEVPVTGQIRISQQSRHAFIGVGTYSIGNNLVCIRQIIY